jgi:hypothetical protein
MQQRGCSMYIVQHMHWQSCLHSFSRQESVQWGMGKGWGKPLSRFVVVSCPRGCYFRIQLVGSTVAPCLLQTVSTEGLLAVILCSGMGYSLFPDDCSLVRLPRWKSSCLTCTALTACDYAAVAQCPFFFVVEEVAVLVSHMPQPYDCCERALAQVLSIILLYYLYQVVLSPWAPGHLGDGCACRPV